jgi:hypothetical protein
MVIISELGCAYFFVNTHARKTLRVCPVQDVMLAIRPCLGNRVSNQCRGTAYIKSIQGS